MKNGARNISLSLFKVSVFGSINACCHYHTVCLIPSGGLFDCLNPLSKSSLRRWCSNNSGNYFSQETKRDSHEAIHQVRDGTREKEDGTCEKRSVTACIKMKSVMCLILISLLRVSHNTCFYVTDRVQAWRLLGRLSNALLCGMFLWSDGNAIN